MNNMGDVLRDLNRIARQVSGEPCSGCGCEHSCKTCGCAIIRDAMETINTQRKDLADAKARTEKLLEDLKKTGDLCSICAFTYDHKDDCPGDCECCELSCACYECNENSSSFVWRGDAKA